MKIVAIVICKNEEAMLPFFFEHYDAFIDAYVFFDNGSTDRSLELIQAHPNTHVVHVNTLGHQKEEINTYIRNEAFRHLALEADWFVVVDVDEFVCHEDGQMRAFLEDCVGKDITMPRVNGFNMYAERPPEPGKPIIEQIDGGVRSNSYSKFAVFHKRIEQMNYIYGAHRSDPRGQGGSGSGIHLSLLHMRVNNIGLFHSVNNSKGYRWSYHTNELIPRNYTGRIYYTLSKADCLKWKLPVHRGPFEAAYADIEARAQAGEADACYQLGYIHHAGHLRPENFELGIAWYEKAAAQEHALALYSLGYLHMMGWGTPLSLERAEHYYRRSADAGCLESQYQMGFLYGWEEGWPRKDLDVARQYLQKAYEGEHIEATFLLSTIMPDATEAERLEVIRKGAELGNLFCLFNLACHYHNQGDLETAYRYYLKSGYRGFNQGYDRCKQFVDEGLGCPKDLEGSLEWFSTAIERQMKL